MHADPFWSWKWWRFGWSWEGFWVTATMHDETGLWVFLGLGGLWWRCSTVPYEEKDR